MTAAGAVTVNPYIEVGPTIQTIGYGWGTSTQGTETWGTERTTSTVTLEPGNWSLDNFGEVLVATIFNGKTFTWNAGASGARAQLTWTSLEGERYAAIGTSQGLFLYYGNDFFDITPLDTAITGGTLTTVNASKTVTINKGSHGLSVVRS